MIDPDHRQAMEEAGRDLKRRAAEAGVPVEEGDIMQALRARVGTLEHDQRTLIREQIETEAALKLDINALLWKHVPASMTIGQTEELAIKIFGLIADLRSKP